ncbi:uncharacterized protein [Miscanthus floridulus]|uniref:uncharacterized protein isoform X2 n=1 Tax=Miscanthus floridulus TaxID=154761 RepID=UPI00345783E1
MLPTWVPKNLLNMASNLEIGYPLGLGGACSAGSPDGIYHGANQTFPDWPPHNFAWLDELLPPQTLDFDYLRLGLGLMPGQQNVWEAPAPKQTDPEKQKRGNVHSDLVSEISHPAHPEHKLKLMRDASAPFLCDGCKEPGYGPRYTCDRGGGGQSLDLHTRCALAGDPLFDLHSLVLPLFGYGKQFEFRVLQEAPSPPVQEEGRRVCDACGEATRGFVYHCSDQDVHLHPCCASLPDRFLQDGRAFDLHRRASRPCALCPDNKGQRRWFWAYRCYVDGDEVVELHVACLKEMARRSWEACYLNRDVGDGALNVDSMLENMFSSTFGDIAGTLGSFITALVFGSLVVKM